MSPVEGAVVFDVLCSGFMRVSLDQVRLQTLHRPEACKPNTPLPRTPGRYSANFFLLATGLPHYLLPSTALRRYYLERNTLKVGVVRTPGLQPERSSGARAEGFLPNCCPGSSRFYSLH